ncbi:cyclic nucleotide-binding domain-containing protein [Paludisphaera mucosa]|uniref:Cyclic nucleotide-binding domain-containing protein n=1 Tax=Paludisphaera mucosa TaxID=3030827 RepID=A0ABT6F4W0_9BACT|nr:cyclic nucleotide-binding domain-containing protein [Paludisphaera mucosa]MDG3002589.1 cyclic nucleotide-binding domain-containing protein [Paludisphaera mucosa]
MINAEAADRFMAAPWLESTDREAKQQLLGSLAEERAAKGTILLAQGQPNDHLAFLIEGAAEIERRSDGGRNDLITTLKAPAVFGTTSFFRPNPPQATVRATSDVWLLTLHHPAYETLRRDHPRAAEALAVAVLRAVSERFDLIDKLFADYIQKHPHAPSDAISEWSRFRARLFEEHAI